MSAATRRSIAERYRHFAEIEAAGRSRLYVEIADAVSRSDSVLAFLASMPAAKQQPNLLFGVVRYLYGTPATPRSSSPLSCGMQVRSRL